MIAALSGYLLGALPSAAFASALAGKTDLSTTGTGNPGAYNAARQMGMAWGLAVGAADVFKGSLAAFIGRALAGDVGASLAATTAVAGHAYPPGRRGGRAVATSVGTCAVVFPVYIPVDFAVAGATALALRHRPAGRRARPAVLTATACFTFASLLWAWRRWPNLWGLRPGMGLAAYGIGSSAVMLARWWS